MTKGVYWIGHVGKRDDFDYPIFDEFIDGKTKMGPWGIMSPFSWKLYGVGELGLGRGQRYVRQISGRWLKVEG